MTKKDLHNQRLVEEANHACLHFYTRRHFLRESAMGLGALALGSLIGCRSRSSDGTSNVLFDPAHPLAPKLPPFPGKAKAVIYLHMAGAPSQLELFDYKPALMKLDGQDCPESLLEGKRFAFIRGVPKMLGPQAKFAQHGESRAWVSEHLPHFSTIVDEVSFLKAVTTDQFNHAPAQLLMHTGGPRLGRPSMGSWVTYGLGTENQNLPGFVVLTSGGKLPDAGQFDWGWDSHGSDASLAIDVGFINKCRQVDKSITALILDLKQRGLLEETLVIWGGEFGRTPMQENREGKQNPFKGRDHHTEAFTIWMAGAGIKKGGSYGETDEIGYSTISGKVEPFDVQATILNQLGFDNEKFT